MAKSKKRTLSVSRESFGAADGVKLLVGLILLVGLPILFVIVNLFMPCFGNILLFFEFIFMAIFGYAYPKITGLA